MEDTCGGLRAFQMGVRELQHLMVSWIHVSFRTTRLRCGSRNHMIAYTYMPNLFYLRKKRIYRKLIRGSLRQSVRPGVPAQLQHAVLYLR